MRFDPATIASRDPQQMLALITRFPRMSEEAWSLGPAGVTVKSPQAVVAVGMCGSGIGRGFPGAAPVGATTGPGRSPQKQTPAAGSGAPPPAGAPASRRGPP